MVKPRPTQISGAAFLAGRARALLADAPRVGKTGAAIIAADLVLADTILVVTTASGRAVWRQAFTDWSVMRRSKVQIVSWAEISKPQVWVDAMRVRWDVLILDEVHYAKNFETKRTMAVFGDLSGRPALVDRADHAWALSGTPAPNNLNDLYPLLRVMFPERLASQPDVTNYKAFLDRYCDWFWMKLPRSFGKRLVVKGGKNLPELRERMAPIMLRRAQQDVGITEPIYETFPLAVSSKVRRAIESQIDVSRVLAAAESGNTADMDMELGTLRRLTGAIKAPLLADAIKEEFDCGLEKVVVMAWHHATLDILATDLADFGVAEVRGSTLPALRDRACAEFSRSGAVRVFAGQIQAAGEAIDLSAAAELVFCETSLVPKDMAQAALRITNFNQTRIPRVRVAVLEGSIDETVEKILLRKWSSISEVIR